MDTIPAQLPFVFDSTMLPAGRRAPKAATLYKLVDVALPAPTDAQAPVSVRWRRRHGQAFQCYFDHRAEVEARTFEGRSYSPLGRRAPVALSDFLGRVARPLGTEEWGADGNIVADWWDCDLPLLPGLSDGLHSRAANAYVDYDHYVAANSLRAGEPRVLETNEPDRRARSRVMWRDSLIVVDGAVWASSPNLEPRYEIRRLPHSVELVACRDYHHEGRSGVIPFRADRRGEAVEFGTTLAAATGRTFNDCGEILEVEDPALLVADDAVSMALALVHGLKPKFTDKGEWSADMREAYVDLYRASREDRRDPEWAGAAFSAFGRLRASTPFDFPAEGVAARVVAHGSFTHDRWMDYERHCRPDVAVASGDDLEGCALTFG